MGCKGSLEKGHSIRIYPTEDQGIVASPHGETVVTPYLDRSERAQQLIYKAVLRRLHHTGLISQPFLSQHLDHRVTRSFPP